METMHVSEEISCSAGHIRRAISEKRELISGFGRYQPSCAHKIRQRFEELHTESSRAQAEVAEIVETSVLHRVARKNARETRARALDLQRNIMYSREGLGKASKIVRSPFWEATELQASEIIGRCAHYVPPRNPREAARHEEDGPETDRTAETTHSDYFEGIFGPASREWERRGSWRVEFSRAVANREKRYGRSQRFYGVYRRAGHLERIGCTDWVAACADDATEGSLALTEYSRRILSRDLPPVDIVAPEATSLSLPHLSLGDAYGDTLAKVLNKLPKLTAINVRDNRLTDEGIQEIIEAICSRKGSGIRLLDLSLNKLDAIAAEGLCTFLQEASCSLEELYLSKADMNDVETHIFMKALEVNRSIKVLDFSDNIIGGEYEKLQSCSVSGGQAIAKALQLNTTLTVLNLSWNRLGSSSGVMLGNALEGNHTLEVLNVAYNAISDSGAQALGRALRHNKGLRALDISYNDITWRGAIVLAQALEWNDHLRDLQLNGNSIGAQGGRCLMRSLNFWQVDRVLGLTNCALETVQHVDRVGGGDFDPLYPTGVHHLNLGNPYEWAVASELLRCASLNPSCSIRSCTLDGKGVELLRSTHCLQYFGCIRRFAEDTLYRYERSYTMPQKSAQEWHKDFGRLLLINRASGSPFALPEAGVLDVEFAWTPLPATELQLLNASGLSHLIQLLRGHVGLRMVLIELAGKDLFFTSHQVQTIIRESGAKDGLPFNTAELVELLLQLVPQILDTTMLRNVLEINLNPGQQQELQEMFGPAFTAYTDCVCGHYRLDLGREFDREAALRLAEWSNWENRYLRATSGWDASSGGTSQNGRWSNFRNATFRSALLRRGIHEGFFKHGLLDRAFGVLEFDFVSTSRPPPTTTPLNPAAFTSLLRVCRISGEDRASDVASAKDEEWAHVIPSDAARLRFLLQSKRASGSVSSSSDPTRVMIHQHTRQTMFDARTSTRPQMVAFLKKCQVFPDEWPSVLINSLWCSLSQGYSSLRGTNRCTMITHILAVRLCHADLEMILRLTDIEAIAEAGTAYPASHLNPSYFMGNLKAPTGNPAADLRPEAKALLQKVCGRNLDTPGMWITARETRRVANCRIVMSVPDVRSEIYVHVLDAYISGMPISSSLVLRDRHLVWTPAELSDPLPPESPPVPQQDWPQSLKNLRWHLAAAWLSTEQIAEILRQFPAALHCDVIVASFSRIVDIEGFWKILDKLDDKQQIEVAHRLGWLNILDFEHIDRLYDLDLRNSDHHRLAEALTDLAIEEPGPNFQEQKFSRHSDSATHEWIPGWDLPSRWSAKTAAEYVTDPGVPHDGHMIVRYCSDHALGCSPNMSLRLKLRASCALAGVPSDQGLGMYAALQANDVLGLMQSD